MLALIIAGCGSPSCAECAARPPLYCWHADGQKADASAIGLTLTLDDNLQTFELPVGKVVLIQLPRQYGPVCAQSSGAGTSLAVASVDTPPSAGRFAAFEAVAPGQMTLRSELMPTERDPTPGGWFVTIRTHASPS